MTSGNAIVLKTTFHWFCCGLLSIWLFLPFTAADAQSIQLTAEELNQIKQLRADRRANGLGALGTTPGDQAGFSAASRGQESSGATQLLSPIVAPAPISEVPRAGANSRLVIQFSPKKILTAVELDELIGDPVLSRLRGNRAFILDEFGVLSLLGVEIVPLLGLTETDIERRLGAEPLLTQFDIYVRILNTRAAGVEALRPFGYEIFEPHEAGFDPPMTGPVPLDYMLGPGDSVRIQFFGNVNAIFNIEVGRDGVLNVPEIGPVTIAGLTFSEFRSDINQRVTEMLIGTQASVTMGELRTMRVFVLGDANRPGSYVLSSLATMSSALYRSGGISRAGTLRNIQLKRNGKIVVRLDLYDLLLNGDTSNDARLQPGDAIFIPPIGSQVSVSGAIRRPAIYETGKNASIADVIGYAGGLLPDAFADGARIERIEANQEKIVISVDADNPASTNAPVRAGDVLTIPYVLPELEDTITLAGHVHRPGPYQWQKGMRLTDLIDSALLLKPGADKNYVMIRREDPADRSIHVRSADLAAALSDPTSVENIILQPRDTVHIFSLAFGRQRVIQPILDELQTQSRYGEPYREVSVVGSVNAPGTYPLEPGMRVSDLIRAGGKLSEDAYAITAELARYQIIDDRYRVTEVVDIDLDAVIGGDSHSDKLLEEHDNLRISSVPEWDSLWTVILEGEVKFPGEYRIRRGETLGQILERAGGLTGNAFPEGTIFLRELLRKREQEQLLALARRLEADIASMSLLDARDSVTGSETLAYGKELLSQLRATEAVGRLVIDPGMMSASSRDADSGMDVELRDGDHFLVPQQAQEVTVIGETQQNASHLYQPGLTHVDYISMSGGLTRRADKKLIYVVRSNGSIETRSRSRWFARRRGMEIRAGDTIVVPLEIDRIRPLTFWTNVTQILYQSAIAVAAVKTFDN